jgi:hypothetical protein
VSARVTIRCTASNAESFSGITRILVSFLPARQVAIGHQQVVEVYYPVLLEQLDHRS